MNTNQATTFQSHFDAKKKLQNQVTINFARGAFKWGWRLALFTSSYVGITTIISVYRGKSSMVEYVTAGTVTGAAYKFNLGLRGILVGGGLGGALGSVAGGLSLLILNATGMTMEEVRYWQYKWKRERDSTINEAIKTQIKIDEDNILEEHDKKIGTEKISLDNLEKENK